MPVAIEFFLDEPSATVIRGVWREIAEAGISPYLNESGVRPHLTLAVGERVDETEAQSLLRVFAAETPALAVSFAHVSISPTDPANLFLSAIVTEDLLRLHVRLHERLSAVLSSPSDRYLPGRWVPHCTLVERVPAELISQTVEVCRRPRLPLDARLIEIGVVEWRPVRQICAFPLGGG